MISRFSRTLASPTGLAKRRAITILASSSLSLRQSHRGDSTTKGMMPAVPIASADWNASGKRQDTSLLGTNVKPKFLLTRS